MNMAEIPVAENRMKIYDSVFPENTQLNLEDSDTSKSFQVSERLLQIAGHLSIHWYNPLVWWAASLSRQDAELACDEATIAKLGEDERLEYGKTLIELTCKKKDDLFITATTMSSKKKNVRERITFIAKHLRKKVFHRSLSLIRNHRLRFIFGKTADSSFYSRDYGFTTSDLGMQKGLPFLPID